MGITVGPQFSKEQLLGFYRQMVTIRYFEEDVVKLFGKGLISGSTHPCIAQEAISVGAIAALEKDDQVLATYRGHGQCLAKGGDPKKALAELLNRDTGYCKGKGGSMHLCDPEIGFMGANAIVAAHIPIAAGVALSNMLRKNQVVTLCFFGDGASCEGVFYETANIAALWKLPVVLICENNEYAISVHVDKSISVKNISTRASAFGFPGVSIDGNDLLGVLRATKEAVDRARRSEGPTLIECKTIRWERHSAISSGKYKSKEDAKRWQKYDPIPRFRSYLVESEFANEDELKQVDEESRKLIDEAVEFAQQSPHTAESRLMEDIFA
jgi:acetoin:2,6-dichlorophenolindophenol oxidoreductase subunit alpha